MNLTAPLPVKSRQSARSSQRMRPLTSLFLCAFCALAAVSLGCAPDTSKLSAGGESPSKGGNTGKGGTSAKNSEAGSNQGGSTNNTASGASTGGSVVSSGGSGGAVSSGGAGGATATTSTVSAIAEAVDVGLTYSGQPADMSMVTVGNQQFVAYWNGETAPGKYKYLTVASRVLGETTWKKNILGAQIGPDGHHGIAMAADKQGYLHVAGGMHNFPLKGHYWHTTVPFDITSFQAPDSMIGVDESSCTYPQFFIGPIGDIVFSYRSGSSGQGDTIFNYYNAEFGVWNRLLGTKLIDGGGVDSAYIVGPVKGPDDYWHLVWTWRGTADANTNHDLSYARTKDFKNWETGMGAKLTLPITLATADIVDHVPIDGGMINNNTKVGFDSQKRPVIVYHKYDSTANRYTQLYNARIENGVWVTHQTSSWNYQWNIAGYNTLLFEIEVDGVKSYPNGQLKQLFFHAQYGGWGGFLLDETTLAAAETIPPPFPYPAQLAQRESSDTNMVPKWAADAGSGPDADIYYMMRWETLPPNGDHERIPEPVSTMLRVYGFKRSVMATLK